MTREFEKKIQILKIILGVVALFSIWYMYSDFKADQREKELLQQVKELDL